MGNLLWFFIGAGAATVYTRRRDHLQQHEDFQSGGSSHRCHSHSPQTHSSQEVAQASSPDTEPFFRNAPSINNSAPTPSLSQDASGSSSTTSSSDPWAVEKERMREIGNQVGVNVLEFSESTLDTLLSSIASMKARVVQQRLDREKHEEKKNVVEEQKQDPLRYV
ncbi:MAG: hypothetical protein NXY57DRAFT_121596 [Lentinula lateritia]|uniref:Peroxin-14 n=1 Tax=Lentinula lateritia TaxID=40482 RepID=A0ABQ8VI89_9AGAR|nr:MAG: hypothetical protein NXY57DRAFT_121596 [Lentinula lateritia]KAJ4495351.1 hypothetical protein C8R41DRAFT_918798 [Lentinula lateritia]